MSNETATKASDADMRSLTEKLIRFSDGLTPAERTIFAELIRLMREGAGDAEGYALNLGITAETAAASADLSTLARGVIAGLADTRTTGVTT